MGVPAQNARPTLSGSAPFYLVGGLRWSFETPQPPVAGQQNEPDGRDGGANDEDLHRPRRRQNERRNMLSWCARMLWIRGRVSVLISGLSGKWCPEVGSSGLTESHKLLKEVKGRLNSEFSVSQNRL